MRLEIDAGNTFIKWRLIGCSEELLDRGVLESSFDAIKYFVKMSWLSNISVVLVSSVLEEAFELELGRRLLKKNPDINLYIANSVKCSALVEFVYEDVSSLGVDRCLVMLAAYTKAEKGVLVIDCGSAMTADIVLTSGKHIGGYIFPGFNLIKVALLKGTSKVYAGENFEENSLPGKSTKECVANGVTLMMKSTLKELIDVAREYGVSNVYLTGGDGVKAQSLIECESVFEEDLVFDGLSLLNPYVEK